MVDQHQMCASLAGNKFITQKKQTLQPINNFQILKDGWLNIDLFFNHNFTGIKVEEYASEFRMRKILVVDDDTDILELLKTYLTWNEYDVRTTTSCKEGMQIFHSFQPDLVLLDINVGNDDGREMCRKIKIQAEYEHIPVILFSANPDLLEMADHYGATATIDKPFDLSELLALFKKHLVN